MDLSETLKALADTNRLRILNLLGTETLCVCYIEDILKLEQSNLSRHLGKLKQMGLVTATKKGQFVYYTRTSIPEPYGRIINDLYQVMAKDPTWEADRQALALQNK